MPWLKKHSALKKQIREQGLNVPGQGFVQQATALYESRIAKALSAPDTGEKYAALLNLHEEMQGYINENSRLLKGKAETAAIENRAPGTIGAITIFAMTVTAVAFYAALGGLPALLSDFVLGMAGVGELLALSGVITLATGKERPDHFEKLAADENAAFNSLSSKVKKEMISLAGQAPAQISPPPVKATPLTRLNTLKMRFLNASRNVPYQQVVANSTVPQEKLHATNR